MRRTRGYTLVEVLVVVGILGLMVSVTTPAIVEINRRRAIRAAASEMRGIFNLVRAQAVARGRNRAVKFVEAGGEWRYAIYEDGNWNGVSNAEIATGTDRLVQPYRQVLQGGGSCRIGTPARSIPDPQGHGAIRPNASPIRFNRSELCSFSSLGAATSGSVFLTDDRGGAAAVVVYGPTGRVRVMVLDGSRWKQL